MNSSLLSRAYRDQFDIRIASHRAARRLVFGPLVAFSFGSGLPCSFFAHAFSLDIRRTQSPYAFLPSMIVRMTEFIPIDTQFAPSVRSVSFSLFSFPGIFS